MGYKEESLKLKNWAVIGASDKKEKYGYKIVKVLNDNDYNVFPVNPRLEEIDGLKCYESINDIDEKIDVVDMVVKPEIGQKVIPDIADKNIEYIWLQPGTRSEKIDELTNKFKLKVIKDCVYATLI
ncbi:MAG: CoA-binding protein [Bacillota bacterium]